MSDLMTAKAYDKILEPYTDKIEVSQSDLSLLLLDNIQYPRTGEAWKLEESKIHTLYEKLYNLSVDALEDNIEKVSLAQLAKLHNYVINRYQFKEFQFFTPKEVKEYADNKLLEVESKYQALINKDLVSPEIQKAIADARKDYQKMYAASEKKYKRVIALAQSTGLDEVTVETMIAEGLAQGKVQVIESAFNHLSANQLIGVLGKDGIMRNYQPSYIVNSLSRDLFHENQADNTRKVTDAYGFQLIRISSHNTRTEICQYYEGGTFAKDLKASKETGFPVLDMDTPFHNGCLHNMFPEDYDFLKMKGEIDETKGFSQNLVTANKNKNVKDITKSPVYPKGYIAPSDRPTIPLKQQLKTEKELSKLKKNRPTAETDKSREAIDKKIIVRENRLKRGGIK